MKEFKFLRKSMKDAVRFIDPAGMQKLLDAEQYLSFVNIHETLCDLADGGYLLNEDQEDAVRFVFEKFKHRTGEVLAEFRQIGDAKVRSGITPGKKEQAMLADIDADTFKALAGDQTTKRGIYDSLKSLTRIKALSEGQQDFVDLFEFTRQETVLP